MDSPTTNGIPSTWMAGLCSSFAAVRLDCRQTLAVRFRALGVNTALLSIAGERVAVGARWRDIVSLGSRRAVLRRARTDGGRLPERVSAAALSHLVPALATRTAVSWRRGLARPACLQNQPVCPLCLLSALPSRYLGRCASYLRFIPRDKNEIAARTTSSSAMAAYDTAISFNYYSLPSPPLLPLSGISHRSLSLLAFLPLPLLLPGTRARRDAPVPPQRMRRSSAAAVHVNTAAFA